MLLAFHCFEKEWESIINQYDSVGLESCSDAATMCSSASET